MWFTSLTPDALAQAQTQARVHDLARQQAEQLREAAMADFWRGANAMLHRAQLSPAAQKERSARRWQARLARRQQALAGDVGG